MAHKHTKATGHKLTYYGQWDSYYCKICKAWVEQLCGSKSCNFCDARPIQPTEEPEGID